MFNKLYYFLDTWNITLIYWQIYLFTYQSFDGLVGRTPVFHAVEPGSIPRGVTTFFSIILWKRFFMDSLHLPCNINHNFTPDFLTSLHSIVDSIPDFHPGGWGSIPHDSKLVQLFIHFFQKNQTLRAKISPFPWKNSGNILISYSHEPKDRFKAIKFLVGWKVMGTFCLSGRNSLC